MNEEKAAYERTLNEEQGTQIAAYILFFTRPSVLPAGHFSLSCVPHNVEAVEALQRQHAQLVTRKHQIGAQLEAEEKEMEELVATNQDLKSTHTALQKKVEGVRATLEQAQKNLQRESESN